MYLAGEEGLLRRAWPLAIAVLLASMAASCSGQSEARWKPGPTTQPWQFQLQGKIDRGIPAPVFETDGDFT